MPSLCSPLATVSETPPVFAMVTVSEPVPPVTVAGTPAAEDITFFRVARDVANDTLGVDAKLIGIAIFMTIDAGNDA